MQSTIEEKIKEDIRSGKSEPSIRSYVEQQQLDEDLTQYLLGLVDDEVAIHELRKIRTRDANLIVYMGYIFIAVAVFFGIYNLAFGASIFVVGFIVLLRGRKKASKAMEIKSIEELLPYHATKFHKRRI